MHTVKKLQRNAGERVRTLYDLGKQKKVRGAKNTASRLGKSIQIQERRDLFDNKQIKSRQNQVQQIANVMWDIFKNRFVSKVYDGVDPATGNPRLKLVSRETIAADLEQKRNLVKDKDVWDVVINNIKNHPNVSMSSTDMFDALGKGLPSLLSAMTAGDVQIINLLEKILAKNTDLNQNISQTNQQNINVHTNTTHTQIITHNKIKNILQSTEKDLPVPTPTDLTTVPDNLMEPLQVHALHNEVVDQIASAFFNESHDALTRVSVNGIVEPSGLESGPVQLEEYLNLVNRSEDRENVRVVEIFSPEIENEVFNNLFMVGFYNKGIISPRIQTLREIVLTHLAVKNEGVIVKQFRPPTYEELEDYITSHVGQTNDESGIGENKIKELYEGIIKALASYAIETVESTPEFETPMSTPPGTPRGSGFRRSRGGDMATTRSDSDIREKAINIAQSYAGLVSVFNSVRETMIDIAKSQRKKEMLMDDPQRRQQALTMNGEFVDGAKTVGVVDDSNVTTDEALQTVPVKPSPYDEMKLNQMEERHDFENKKKNMSSEYLRNQYALGIQSNELLIKNLLEIQKKLKIPFSVIDPKSHYTDIVKYIRDRENKKDLQFVSQKNRPDLFVVDLAKYFKQVYNISTPIELRNQFTSEIEKKFGNFLDTDLSNKVYKVNGLEIHFKERTNIQRPIKKSEWEQHVDQYALYLQTEGKEDKVSRIVRDIPQLQNVTLILKNELYRIGQEACFSDLTFDEAFRIIEQQRPSEMYTVIKNDPNTMKTLKDIYISGRNTGLSQGNTYRWGYAEAVNRYRIRIDPIPQSFDGKFTISNFPTSYSRDKVTFFYERNPEMFNQSYSNGVNDMTDLDQAITVITNPQPVQPTPRDPMIDVRDDIRGPPGSAPVHQDDFPDTANITKRRQKAMGTILFNNLDEVIERVELLLGSIGAGNTSKEIKNELQMLLDVLLRKRAINKTTHKKIVTNLMNI